MNTIGVDYQQTVTMVCLSEGNGASTRVRSVGDGLRSLIPNVVQAKEAWGSRALGAGATTTEALREGPWLVEPDASLFWQHLYKRMYGFLGRIAPTNQSGYRIVVGLQAVDYPAAAAGVDRLCEQAGFGRPTCISAPDAVLARYLAEQRKMESDISTIAVVVVGDTATTVCSYRIQREAGSVPRITNQDSQLRTIPFGQAHWTGRLLGNVRELFAEPIRPGFDMALRDAALEFGMRLGRSPRGRAVAWTGPLRDKLFRPLQMTPEECLAWPEASALSRNLPGLIRDSLAALGNVLRPDMVLVGGIGAAWPFALEAAAEVGRVQQSDSPEEDVARGCAWWPEVEVLWSESLAVSGAPSSETVLPDWLVDTPSEPEVSLFSTAANSFSFPTQFETIPEQDAALPLWAEESEAPVPALKEEFGFAPIEPTSAPLAHSEYDFPVPECVAALPEEEKNLENLPPWDPRRNDL